MGKIGNYITDSNPQPTDKVIGTDVGDDNKTKNYTLQSIADLAGTNTLQQVLDAGNNATQSLTLIGLGTFGNLSILGTLQDSTGSIGGAGQVLKSQGGAGVLWQPDGLASLAHTKIWVGDPANNPVEAANIIDDETPGAETLSINAISSSVCTISNGVKGEFLYPIGNQNLSIGATSFNALTALAENNTAMGYRAGQGITDGDNNTLMGNLAGGGLGLQNNNVGIGYQALGSNTNSENTALGSQAMRNSPTGQGNTVVGFESGNSINSGNFNVVMGHSSGQGIALSSNNIAIGNATMGADADRSVAIGYQAMPTATGRGNIAIGYQAADDQLGGDENIAIGTQTVNSGASWNDANIAIGFRATTTIPGVDSSIALGVAADIQRSREFVLSPELEYLCLNTNLSARMAPGGVLMFPDNAAAVAAGLRVGDIYSVTAVAPAAAVLAVVY